MDSQPQEKRLSAPEQIGLAFDKALYRKEVKVIVTDVRMPFWSMVAFMVKAAIAAIPAFIILTMLFFVLAALVPGLGRMFH